MQRPDFTSMKTAFLMALSKCASSSQLRSGLAKDVCDFTYYLCRDSRRYSVSAIEQFTSPERQQLEKDLLAALPELERNLEDTYSLCGPEKVAGFRRVRSGLQFLQDEIVAKQDNRELGEKMRELLDSEFVKEVDDLLKLWNEQGEWDKDENLDLRFIPASHNWYLDEQRYASKLKYGSGDAQDTAASSNAST